MPEIGACTPLPGYLRRSGPFFSLPHPAEKMSPIPATDENNFGTHKTVPGPDGSCCVLDYWERGVLHYFGDVCLDKDAHMEGCAAATQKFARAVPVSCCICYDDCFDYNSEDYSDACNKGRRCFDCAGHSRRED